MIWFLIPAIGLFILAIPIHELFHYVSARLMGYKMILKWRCCKFIYHVRRRNYVIVALAPIIPVAIITFMAYYCSLLAFEMIEEINIFWLGMVSLFTSVAGSQYDILKAIYLTTEKLIFCAAEVILLFTGLVISCMLMI